MLYDRFLQLFKPVAPRNPLITLVLILTKAFSEKTAGEMLIKTLKELSSFVHTFSIDELFANVKGRLN